MLPYFKMLPYLFLNFNSVHKSDSFKIVKVLYHFYLISIKEILKYTALLFIYFLFRRPFEINNCTLSIFPWVFIIR